jgi:hypothetical protein
MRISTTLMIGASAIAIASPAFAQTSQENSAQQANPPGQTPSQLQDQGEIIVTATKRASRV